MATDRFMGSFEAAWRGGFHPFKEPPTDKKGRALVARAKNAMRQAQYRGEFPPPDKKGGSKQSRCLWRESTISAYVGGEKPKKGGKHG